MKREIRHALALALCMFGAGLQAADYTKVTDTKLFNGETLSEFKLPNGFRVLHLPRHQAKVLTYQVWFDVGSVDEKMDPKLKKTGLAHLFEHMMFRGSEKYPDGKFDEITSRLGADRQNATTFYYRTNYFESIPSHNLEPLMELESDRMRNLKLTADLLEKEKGAVVGEYRRHMDNPSAVANDEAMRLVFQKAPYRFTVLGSEEEIKGFSLEEAQYFYKTFYAPNNATLIIVGDVTENVLMPMVVKYYGGMTSQEIPKIEMPPEEPQKKERFFETKHPQASSETLIVAYRGASILTDDAIVFSLMGTHLSTGMEARLRKALIDPGIAVRASAGPSAQPDLFEFFIQLAENHKAEEAIRIIDREVALLKSQPISKASFERALNQERLSIYGEITENSSLASFLGEYLMLSGNYMRGFDIIEGYNKLTPANLQKVARQYLKNEYRSVVVVRPEKKGKS